MGIKFHCANGHKLHVKSFLAGKKAVCPKCGLKVVVPNESQLPKEAEEADPDDPFANGNINTGNPAKVASMSAAPSSAQPIAPATLQPAQPTVAAISPRSVHGVVDFIAEAPTAVWYVRPSSGGQFGPAAGDVMRGWLVEGRVSADSLVWRAGWPDWQSASTVFPQLVGASITGVAPAAVAPAVVAPTMGTAMHAPAMGTPVGMAPVMVASSPMMAPVMAAGLPMGQALGGYAAPMMEHGATDYEDAVSRTRRKKKKAANATVIVSSILVGLVILLFVILGIVLVRQNAESPEPVPAKSVVRRAVSTPQRTPEKKQAAKPERVEPLPADDSQFDPPETLEIEMKE